MSRQDRRRTRPSDERGKETRDGIRNDEDVERNEEEKVKRRGKVNKTKKMKEKTTERRECDKIGKKRGIKGEKTGHT